MDKVPFELSDQVKKDAVSLGVIASLGGLGNLASSKLLKPGAGALKVFAAGTGLGLAGDYVGIKIGNAYTKHVDEQMKNKYITKIASTALSRRINDGKTPNLSATHSNELFSSAGAANKAMDKARAGGSSTAEIVRRQGQASTQSAKQISSSNLNKLVGSGGSDPLATSSIRDRLAAKRQSMNLPDPKGDKSVQIRNANAIKTGPSTPTVSKAGPGMSGLSNASKVNDALVAAKDGRKAHLNLDMRAKAIGVDTVAKKVVPEAAHSGLLSKARQLMKHPLARKVGIGAGLVGLGAAAATAISNKTAEPAYAY